MLASVSANGADATVVHASTVLALIAGDYVEVVGKQGSGGALDIESARSHAILQYIGE